MDFTTMRQRHAEGAYTEWDSLQEDMRTMFSNAMSFNPPETLYHKQVGRASAAPGWSADCGTRCSGVPQGLLMAPCVWVRWSVMAVG
jgi:Bromodomain